MHFFHFQFPVQGIVGLNSIQSCLFLFPDFDNHIYVTTDAEAFFFLHDLISSYLKEKERVLNIQQQQHGNTQQMREKQEQMENNSAKTNHTSNGGPSSERGGNTNETNPSKFRTNSTLVHIDPLQNDWRQFECNTWHLEPTVRLISWAGKNFFFKKKYLFHMNLNP